MALVLTETKTPVFAEGWKSLEISKCKTGDYNGTKFYDLWFQGLPDTLNCRVWESRNKDGEEFSIANLIRYSNPDIIEEMDAFLGDVAPLGFAYLSPRSLKFNVEPSKTCEAPGCACQEKAALGLYLGFIDGGVK